MKIRKHDPASLVLYGLCYHYIGNRSFFEGENYESLLEELPAERLINLVELKNLIKAEDLLRQTDDSISIIDISKSLEEAIVKTLNNANTNKVSLSITGGLDSRILLSILKKLDVELHGYTYGNPDSIDCVVAKEIAKKLEIPHKIYNIVYDNVSFRKAAEESIKLGNSLSSLHRAHRVEAAKNEAQFADIMFLGTMGGEFIKGADQDDYIVSKFVYKYSEKPELETVKKHMKLRGLWQNEEIAAKVKEVMDKQPYIYDKANMELHALIEIAAKLHHGQNTIQYSQFIPHVHTPFCDPDYMKILFKSKYNFLYRRKHQSPMRYKKDNPRFGTSMQYHLDKELSKLIYSYRFNASEYLFSPFYAGIVAKLRKKRMKNPPTFSLGQWMEDFVKDTLQEILDSKSFINDYYNIPTLLAELNRDRLPQTEPFWLKYTCPIQLYLTQKIYGVTR